MYKSALLFIVISIVSLKAWSYPNNSYRVIDTTLQEVTVAAFNTNQQWKDAPAAVSILIAKELNAQSPISLVSAFNTLPGVRMEERSPGSYRLSIRGSLLRSPFGVRNIKAYWNEIPLSDATGNTYLNLLNLQQINKVEIAKGPSASSYGAGTGGVVLFNSVLPFTHNLNNKYSVLFTIGSFGLHQTVADWQTSTPQFASTVQVSNLHSNGYREQAELNKTSISWLTKSTFKKQELNTLFFYTNLHYQTPGAITKAQMRLNPTLSRQAVGSFPSSIQQKAAVYNQTIFGAIHHTYHWNDQLQVKSFLSINTTQFKNPFITNYEQRAEVNMNAGMQLVYTPIKAFNQFRWINGAEWLFNESSINNFKNNRGIAGTIFSQDMIYSSQQFYFSQFQMKWNNHFAITAGVSQNVQSYQYKKLTNITSPFFNRTILAPWIPRLSVLYQVHKNISAYAIVAAGFSAPSLAEVKPSDGNFYPFLNAEKGWNTELGLKGFLLNNKLAFDIALYQFKLNDAIVTRNDASGAAYFVNAGTTLQKGIELFTKYHFFNNPRQQISSFTISNNFCYQPYRFISYKQGAVDFSGNKLTGVPITTNSISASITTQKQYYVDVQLQLTSSIPLNDSNTEFADAYQLLQMKMGKNLQFKKLHVAIFIGGDNLLNQLYSLGNDINAAGLRYYNPAPERNWYSGIRIGFND